MKVVVEDLDVFKGKNFVLIFYVGEFRILFGEKFEGSFEEKVKFVVEKVKGVGGMVLFKGVYDIISDGKGWKYNKIGNRGMMIGGIGDVLVGLVGVFFVFGNFLLRVVFVGVFLNGFVGDMVKEEMGENFMVLDVVEKVL